MSEEFRVDFDDSVLRRLIADTPDKLDDFLEQQAWKGVNITQSLFDTSPPGRMYVRKGRVHYASQPGYPPNRDTKQLSLSMKAARQSLHRWLIMDGVEWGVVMELGGENSAPRPFIIPMMERLRDEFAEAAREADLLNGE